MALVCAAVLLLGEEHETAQESGSGEFGGLVHVRMALDDRESLHSCIVRRIDISCTLSVQIRGDLYLVLSGVASANYSVRDCLTINDK